MDRLFTIFQRHLDETNLIDKNEKHLLMILYTSPSDVLVIIFVLCWECLILQILISQSISLNSDSLDHRNASL